LWKNATTPDEKAQRLAELEQAYKSLRNDTHEVLANLPHTAGAFALLTKEPIKPDGTTVKFRDELPGRSSNRFFYRVVAVDAAGNKSEPSPASPPVCCPDVTPPKRPVLLEAGGGNKVITLQWMENMELDLDHYLLYLSDKLEAAKDLRTMTLHKRIAKSPTATPPTGGVAPDEVTDADGNVMAGRLQLEDIAAPNVTYHYRLVAVDMSGNRSEPSAVVSGRAYQPPPEPPNLAVPIWDTAHQKVTLTWTHTDQKLESLVERRSQGGLMWISVTGWLTQGVYTHTDEPPDPSRRYEYRIRVRDELGQVNGTYQPRTTP